MRAIKSIAAVIAAGAVLSGCGRTSADGSRLLRYKFSPGQIDRYTVDVSVKVDSAESIAELSRRSIRREGRTAQRVIKVYPNGGAKLEITVEPLRGKGSSPDPGMVPQVVTIDMTPLGEGPRTKLVRGRAIPEKDMFLDPSVLSRLGAVLPESHVKPGDRWTSTAPNPFQASGEVSVESRFFSEDTVRGIPTVRIHQAANIPIGMRLQERSNGPVVKIHGGLKVTSAVQFAPALGKVLKISSLGRGSIRLTPVTDRASKESIVLTLNVDAVSERID